MVYCRFAPVFEFVAVVVALRSFFIAIFGKCFVSLIFSA